jgi:hypothetical protein
MVASGARNSKGVPETSEMIPKTSRYIFWAKGLTPLPPLAPAPALAAEQVKKMARQEFARSWCPHPEIVRMFCWGVKYLADRGRMVTLRRSHCNELPGTIEGS